MWFCPVAACMQCHRKDAPFVTELLTATHKNSDQCQQAVLEQEEQLLKSRQSHPNWRCHKQNNSMCDGRTNGHRQSFGKDGRAFECDADKERLQQTCVADQRCSDELCLHVSSKSTFSTSWLGIQETRQFIQETHSNVRNSNWSTHSNKLMSIITDSLLTVDSRHFTSTVPTNLSEELSEQKWAIWESLNQIEHHSRPCLDGPGTCVNSVHARSS